MSDNVQTVDFGKEHNESVHKFARLMGLVEEQERQMRENPLPFIKEAHAEIVRLRRVIRDAMEAYMLKTCLALSLEDAGPPAYKPMDDYAIRVQRTEHEGLKAMYDVVKAERDR